MRARFIPVVTVGLCAETRWQEAGNAVFSLLPGIAYISGSGIGQIAGRDTQQASV